MYQGEQQEEPGTPPNASLCSALTCSSSTSMTAQEQGLTLEVKGQSPIHLKETQRRRRRHTAFWLIGSVLATSLSAAILLRYGPRLPPRCYGGREGSCRDATFMPWFKNVRFRLPRYAKEILDYQELFRFNTSSSNSPILHKTPARNISRNRIHKQSRHLLGGNGNDDLSYPQLVIAGKMMVDDGPCNIAQYNLKSKRWSLTERIQLSLYNSYSGGEVYSLLANHTFLPPTASEDEEDYKRR